MSLIQFESLNIIEDKFLVDPEYYQKLDYYSQSRHIRSLIWAHYFTMKRVYNWSKANSKKTEPYIKSVLRGYIDIMCFLAGKTVVDFKEHPAYTKFRSMSSFIMHLDEIGHDKYWFFDHRKFTRIQKDLMKVTKEQKLMRRNKNISMGMQSYWSKKKQKEAEEE